MDGTTFRILEPDVRTAAKSVARDWPGVIDEDEAEQEIWAVLLESNKTTNVVCEMDRPNRIDTLKLYGHRVAARYRDDYEFFSGNYHYCTDHVRRLLEADFLSFRSDKPGSITHTEWVDMTAGMERLRGKNASYAFLIEDVFVRGAKLETGAERKQLTRAVDALTVEMNRHFNSQQLNHTEGPGTRQVISNEEAQRKTRSNYAR